MIFKLNLLVYKVTAGNTSELPYIDREQNKINGKFKKALKMFLLQNIMRNSLVYWRRRGNSHNDMSVRLLGKVKVVKNVRDLAGLTHLFLPDTSFFWGQRKASFQGSAVNRYVIN